MLHLQVHMQQYGSNHGLIHTGDQLQLLENGWQSTFLFVLQEGATS